jgi:hypothetical protein
VTPDTRDELDRLTAPRLSPFELVALADNLDQIASAVSKNPARWRMSIPVQDTDSDMVLTRAANTLRLLASPPVATDGWQPSWKRVPAADRIRGADSVLAWLLLNDYHLSGQEIWSISWSGPLGYDFTSLHFVPHDFGWDAIVGHHASGENPRLHIGLCRTLADVQRTHALIHDLNEGVWESRERHLNRPAPHADVPQVNK